MLPPATSRRGIRRLLPRLGLALAPFLLVEGGTRALGLEYPPLQVPIYLAVRGASLDVASQTGLYVPDAHELWTPRPGALLGMVSPDREELINPRGFRGPELARAKKDGVLRVATLGDSSTFGALVPWEDCYSAQLQGELARHGIEAEVLCAGVVGFTARQGLERYRQRVRPFRPDVVVAAFGAINEFQDAKGRPDAAVIAERVAADTTLARLCRWLRLHSRTAHGLAWLSDLPGDGRSEQIESVKASMIAEHLPDPLSGRPDWDGVRRVSTAELDQCLRELAREVEADGARLVVVSMPRKRELEETVPVLLDYTRAVADTCAAGSLALVDAHGAFRASPEAEEALFANPLDTVHPSRLGHRLIAEALALRIAEGLGMAAPPRPIADR